jgi:RNA polymerase sigma-70 factor (ECF subfamily)
MSGTLVTDGELLAQWSAGSRAAGNELIERHFDVVHRFFRNKVGSDIEDLMQQTFLACVEARTRYQGQASFKTFLLAIARNQLFTHYSKRRREVLDFTLTSVHDLGTSPTGVLARREDEHLLSEALRRVPLDAQVVLELAYWEGLDGAEIAQVLEVPLNTAYSRLRRAKIALLDRLRELAPDRVDLDRVVGDPLASDRAPDPEKGAKKDAKNERDPATDKDRASAPVELR